MLDMPAGTGAMQRLEFAMVGYGPAVLASAALFRRDGHHVMLFDRFDAPYPVDRLRAITSASLGSCRSSLAAADSRGVFSANHARRGRQSIITAT